MPPETIHQPKPAWLKQKLPAGPVYEQVRGLLTASGLHTVCQEARCPNAWECFARRTATFLISGPRCSRNCGFCAVATGASGTPDPTQPARVAAAAVALGLRHVVITSVSRDDLADGGASCFADTIREIRRALPQSTIEVLIPDFMGDRQALQTVLAASPDVVNHNIETVPRLYPVARPQAIYHRSLELLSRARRLHPTLPLKSGLMLGLGETAEELSEVLADLLAAGCRMLTIGQYLRPSAAHLPVVRYVTPAEFAAWQRRALDMGFKQAACGPLVRSSYRARELYRQLETRD